MIPKAYLVYESAPSPARISCSAPIYDDDDNFLGVVGFDLLEDFVISEILNITEQCHVDAFLVDGQGKVLIQAGTKSLPPKVVEAINNEREGHIRTDDKLVAYFRLDFSDWYYVVVADSDHTQKSSILCKGSRMTSTD